MLVDQALFWVNVPIDYEGERNGIAIPFKFEFEFEFPSIFKDGAWMEWTKTTRSTNSIWLNICALYQCFRYLTQL